MKTSTLVALDLAATVAYGERQLNEQQLTNKELSEFNRTNRARLELATRQAPVIERQEQSRLAADLERQRQSKLKQIAFSLNRDMGLLCNEHPFLNHIVFQLRRQEMKAVGFDSNQLEEIVDKQYAYETEKRLEAWSRKNRMALSVEDHEIACLYLKKADLLASLANEMHPLKQRLQSNREDQTLRHDLLETEFRRHKSWIRKSIGVIAKSFGAMVTCVGILSLWTLAFMLVSQKSDTATDIILLLVGLFFLRVGLSLIKYPITDDAKLCALHDELALLKEENAHTEARISALQTDWDRKQKLIAQVEKTHPTLINYFSTSNLTTPAST